MLLSIKTQATLGFGKDTRAGTCFVQNDDKEVRVIKINERRTSRGSARSE